MIDPKPAGHTRAGMGQAEAILQQPLAASSGEPGLVAPPSSRVVAVAQRTDVAARDDRRLRRIFDEQFEFVWRYIRRLGLSAADADDAAQRAFVVVARKLDRIEPGKERAFLCGTAQRVVSETRRTAARRHEVADERADRPADSTAQPDQALDRQQARQLLDKVLDAMPEGLRPVFVLFELESMSTAQIAVSLDIPPGTVASRLRRARESFHGIVKRLRARGEIPGGNP